MLPKKLKARSSLPPAVLAATCEIRGTLPSPHAGDLGDIYTSPVGSLTQEIGGANRLIARSFWEFIAVRVAHTLLRFGLVKKSTVRGSHHWEPRKLPSIECAAPYLLCPFVAQRTGRQDSLQRRRTMALQNPAPHGAWSLSKLGLHLPF